MSTFYQHGHIRCGTLVVNDLALSRDLYCEILNQEIAEQGYIPRPLAISWGAATLQHSPYCLLQPQSIPGSKKHPESYLRLIQSPTHQTPVAHATTFGWSSFEINVRDAFELYEKLKGSAFTVVGPPKKMDGISNTIPMQVVGPDQEVLYLNQVLSSDEKTDIPIAEHEVDRIFIVVLGSPDRNAYIDNYAQQLNLNKGPTFELRYSLINRAFNLDPETKHTLSLLQSGRRPVIEIDGYPSQAKARPKPDQGLSLGNAIVSLVVDDLDALDLHQAISHQTTNNEDTGLLYKGARTAVIKGDSNELIELIEYPKS